MTDSSEPRFRIGKVCEMLRDEFPDISISKLRFLQDKGIVDPERTPGGYRMYSPRDIDALRTALHLQRDQFMPLRVIRDELRRQLDGGAPRTAAGADRSPRHTIGVPMSAASDVDLHATSTSVSAEALVRAANVSHEFLEQCRAADIVSGQRAADGLVTYTTDEVALVTFAGRLADLGLDVRHLRQAAMAMSRQGALVEQYASAMLRAPGDEARDRAIDTVTQLTTQLADFMRVAFVRDVRLMTDRTTGRGGSAAQPLAPHAPLI